MISSAAPEFGPERPFFLSAVRERLSFWGHLVQAGFHLS